MKILSYVVFAIAAFTVFIVLCMYTKIRLGIAIIKTAALYVGDVKLSIIIPILTSIVIAAWFIIWLVVFLYRLSYYDKIEKNPDYPISSVSYS